MKVVSVPRDAWLDGDLLAVDRLVHDAEDEDDRVVLAVDADLLEEVALRYQRLEPTTNRHSATDAFAALLAHHRARTTNRAALEHALDTWQWALRLEPEASAEVQVAALLHELGGAALLRAFLAGTPWDADRVADLVTSSAHGGSDAERQLLADADGLSFLALCSAAYLARFGRHETAAEVARAVARASGRVRAWVARIRLPRPVREALRSSWSTPPTAVRRDGHSTKG